MNKLVKRIGITAVKGSLKLIYAPMKLMPTKKGKILFCSRQSNTMPLDFSLIRENLYKRASEVNSDDCRLQCVTVLHRIGDGPKEIIKFGGNTIRSMYHLATAQVCVLDSYWPAVSILDHKKDLKVVQIWHAIGKFKKSGKIAVGETSGRDKETAELLNMHAHNDCIIAGSSVWNKNYCESFGCTEDMLYNYGLPRIDYLIDSEEANRKKFFEGHPELSDKPILLYAPTFRRGMESRWADIIDAVDAEKYHLIIKNHPTQKIEGKRPEKNVRYFDDIDSMELLAVADYVITDYSAISLEAAVLNKKTLFWAYDYDEYIKNNGLNIDLFEVVPGHISGDINELMKIIDEDRYDMSVLENFRKTYLPEDLGTSTRKITDLILHIIKTGELPEKR